jgi:hypothetical protein
MTLKPSSKPPMSLNAPNPTTRTNFSPAAPPPDFNSAFFSDSTSTSTLAFRPLHSHSHSHSHSVSASSHSPYTGYGTLRQRSPSLSQLSTYSSHVQSQHANAGPPQIPLRISSIPADSQPRKLSLHALRTKLSLQNMSASAPAHPSPARSSSTSPPLNTNKDLPSPPTGESPAPHRRIASDPERASVYEHPGIAELPATRPWYPRMSSCPPAATAAPAHMPAAATPGSVAGPLDWPVFPLLQEKLQSSIPGSSTAQRVAATPSPPPAVRESRAAKLEHGAREAPAKPDPEQQQQRGDEQHRQRRTKEKEPRKERPKEKDARSAGPPAQMSRTQRDKDRKKRSKAPVLVEHVDLIKDDFWEARPWILSGTTG